jgi:RimJ/RimL family protein N-acetyltransferase
MTDSADPHDMADYRRPAALRDGTPVVIRAIRADDMSKVVTAFHKLDPRSVYTRFFTQKAALSAQDLARLSADFVHSVVLVVALGSGAEETLIGGVSYYVYVAADGKKVAEVAFTIEEDHQGQGLSTLLLAQVAEIARRQGISRFEAEVLAGNAAMLSVFQRSGLPMTVSRHEGVIHVLLALDPRPPSASAARS